MLIIKEIIINSNCPLCINRYNEYTKFMKKFNKIYKNNTISKLLILLNSKKYISFYIDYLKCFKRFYPKEYKKFLKINKILYNNINKKNPLFNFYIKLCKLINIIR
tara:strand:- start:1817 stop:2134 length:318 start_codon:yes stop_codon:yes gene_type:complete